MRKLLVVAGIFLFFSVHPAVAEESVIQLRQELEQTKALVKKLESRLNSVEQLAAAAAPAPEPVPAAESGGNSSDNLFNPAISAVLMGGYNAYSNNPDGAKIAGFAMGEEAGLPNRGFSLGESELNFASSIDNLFYGSLTAALVSEGGETSVELEEAYIETLALPYGTKVKAGRFFPVLGYLNEIHAHADSFIDRPLPYRAFLGGSNYGDDGVQASVVLPTPWFSEIGGGAYRGTAFPGSGDSHGASSQSAFMRMGGDAGESHSWLAGLSYLHAKAASRETGDLIFSGDTNLYIADVKYTWAPGGNPANQSLTLQGEYFLRNEDGSYNDIGYDRDSDGWYAQAVYKFLPQWKTGYRYARLNGGGTEPGLEGTALDSMGHGPQTHSVLLEFDNSEFSSIRAQYTRDEANLQPNNIGMLWYTVNLGAHGAHKY
ncbi:MAG: hypothetical protein AB7H77_11595 [Bdellovibrionales bacterium]